MRKRDSQRGMATDEIAIVSVILLILVAVALPIFYRSMRRPLRCVESLAAAADGRLPEDARCPYSDLKYAVTLKDGVERLQCPDPARHLEGNPRFERAPGGAWVFRSDAPAAPEAALPVIDFAASVVQGSMAGDTVILEIRPRFWYRYIVGPLLQLVALLFVVTALVNLTFLRKDNPPSILITVSVFGLMAGAFLCFLAPGIEGSETIEFHPREARAVHHTYLFGAEPSAPTTIEGGQGFCLAKREKRFSLLYVGTRNGRRELDPIFGGSLQSDLGMVTWLLKRVPPPR